MNPHNLYRCIAATTLLASAGRAVADATQAATVYPGAAAALPMTLPAFIWAPLLALMSGCAIWLVVLIALQPRRRRPRYALAWASRVRQMLLDKLELPVVAD